jgi:hypothetical protein
LTRTPSAERQITAPAAHLISVRTPPGGGGVLVGHTVCDAPEVFVPEMPGLGYCVAIDIIQAVIGHRCPPGQGETIDDPAGWVTP